jgi:cytochrome c553
MHSLIIIVGVFCFNLYAQDTLSIPRMVDTSCMNCHADPSLFHAPMIAGQKKDFLEFELFNFKYYIRDHEIMSQIMEQFSDQEVKEMALYISNLSLCEAQAPVYENNGADAKKGEQIFSKTCFECHKKDTSGIGPVLHGQKTWYLENAIKSFQTTWYDPRPSRLNMRAYTDMLSKQDIKDVAAFLNEQKLCE